MYCDTVDLSRYGMSELLVESLRQAHSDHIGLKHPEEFQRHGLRCPNLEQLLKRAAIFGHCCLHHVQDLCLLGQRSDVREKNVSASIRLRTSLLYMRTCGEGVTMYYGLRPRSRPTITYAQ